MRDEGGDEFHFLNYPPPHKLNDIQVFNNTAQWIIPQNVIARKISSQDLENLPALKGITIQQGTAAYIYIDGREAAELHGGSYEFVSQTEIDNFLEKKVSAGIGGWLNRQLKGIVTAIKGKKLKDRISENADVNLNNIKNVDDIISRLKPESTIEVYLISEIPFSLIFGSQTLPDGSREFEPLHIRCRHLTADVMVTLQLRVSDPRALITRFLSRSSYLSTYDLEEELKPNIRYILEEELRYIDIDEYGIPATARTSLETKLRTLSGLLPGIEISAVRDISVSNKDFDRLRHISDELFVSDKELEAAIRTNDFRNRLSSVENQARIDEAKNGLSLHKALAEIDKDKILHEDELDAFYILVSRQKQIRDAQNEEEIRKALQDIKASKLISEDEMEALMLQLADKKLQREAISEIINLEHLNKVELKRMDLEDLLTRKRYSREVEELEHTQKIHDKMEDHRRSVELEEGRHVVNKIDIDITGRRKIDEYEDERRAKSKFDERDEVNWKLDVQERIDAQKRKKEKEKMSDFQEMMSALNQQWAEDDNRKYAHELEQKKTDQEHERILRDMDHANSERELDIKSRMASDQILASRTDLSEAAQVELAKGMGDSKVLENERAKNEELKALQRELADRERDSKEQMFDLMKEILHSQNSQRAERDRIYEERIRIQEERAKEYREEKYHAQARQDEYTKHVMGHEEKVQQSTVGAINAMANSRHPQPQNQAENRDVNLVECPNCGKLVRPGKFCMLCSRELSINPNH